MASDPDELARTATAPPGSAPASPTDPVGTSLGRYRIEREIGAGGMGVVHAAFDPDLERRVALKVMRGTGSDAARQRLLREARAMARLTHPNVVVVHEVGSANGRDFVAMELIDGETLADWVRERPRPIRDIMAAFIAAGRGLAAAHRAELVHRDFKPHNVLRSRDGRILVTDFGLARSTEVAPPLEGGASVGPTALSGLTVTGSLLGTPAYMAPEQWNAGKVGPASDQFAFCVALWEALAGTRPFSGLTIDELRAEIERGPDQLDVSKLPRRLRGILRRGLARDPDARWPSMDALLAALVRAERRPYVAVAIAGGALGVLAVVAYLAIGRTAAPVEACDVALRDPAAVWSPAIEAAVRGATSPRSAKVFADDLAAWQVARAEACRAPASSRHARLSCLDGVLARFDAARRAVALAPPPIDDDNLASQLISPAVCLVDAPPRLPTELSPLVQEALALRDRAPGTPVARPQLDAALARAAADPCARAQLSLASFHDNKGSRPRDTADEGAAAAEVCGDDRALAEALIDSLVTQVGEFMDVKQQSLLRRVEGAVKRVSQPSLVAELDMVRGKIALVTEQTDEAIRLFGAAIDGFGDRFPRRQLLAAHSRIMSHIARHTVEDLKRARAEIAQWRPRAEAGHFADLAHDLATADANASWFQGHIAEAHAELARLAATALPSDDPPVEPRAIHGTVVDRNGKPVAGATVVAGAIVIGDAVGIGTRFDSGYLQMFATTDAAGAYTIEHVPATATVIAQLGELRSQPIFAADRDRLVLGPTTHVRGKIVGADTVAATMVVVLSDVGKASPMYQQVAPVAADGTFELAGGVLVGKLRIGALVQRGANQAFALHRIEAGPAGRDDITLEVGVGRRLRVVVRSASSAPLSGARVIIVPGTPVITTVKDMLQVLRGGGMESVAAHGWIGEPPAELAGKLAAGDLVATFATAPTGEASVCAIGLSGDLSDPALERKLEKHGNELEVTCHPLPADVQVIAIDVPPMKRLD